MVGVLPVSPLAPATFPDLPVIDGVRIATGKWSRSYGARHDLLLVALDEGTSFAGRYTKSAMPSAPVDWCRQHGAGGQVRGLVINAGNANAFTGKVGAATVADTAAAAADLLGVSAETIMIASTGVIGEPIETIKITSKLPDLMAGLCAGNLDLAAEAIRTTDTFPKGATASAMINGVEVKIAGIVKGSGMIEPALGTMLGFIFTDAALPAKVLDDLMGPLTDQSFNAITVDSDTSTSDTVMLCATGKAGNEAPQSADDPALDAFRAALLAVMQDLAIQVVKDGEGATKLMTITVTGAVDAAAARRAAKAIANSPLVKTAVAGEDPNWGRIIMAIGKSGEKADRDKVAIDIGGHPVARDGLRIPDYDEAPLAAHMKGQDIVFRVDLGVGTGEATVWSCDLTHGYISINADYRS